MNIYGINKTEKPFSLKGCAKYDSMITNDFHSITQTNGDNNSQKRLQEDCGLALAQP